MRKGIYLYTGSKTGFPGVEKKIKNQIKVFSQYYKMYKVIIEKEDTNIIKSISWRMPGGSWGGKYEETLEEIDTIIGCGGEIAFFYIRISPLDRRYIRFLEVLRIKYDEAIILLEIPTYPYAKEYLQSKTMWPWYFKEILNKWKLSKCVDRIITTSDCGDYIWSIKTIISKNGVDVESISPIQDTKVDNTLRLIAVAQFQPSHGYERVIRGLSEYYANGGKRHVELHMVGDGVECDIYKKLTNELGLNDSIFFYGVLEGNELENCYENKDIGLGEFGLYKRTINVSSSLKVREYLAKGLPVVCGVHNTSFDEGGEDYHYDFPNIPGQIDFNELLSWYDDLISLYGDKSVLTASIRDFSKKTVDISVTMRPIIEYLKTVEECKI